MSVAGDPPPAAGLYARFIELQGVMPDFCVNRMEQPNGDHEVHDLSSTRGCLPNLANRLDLGWHASCAGAVGAAKRHYNRVNGASIAPAPATRPEPMRRCWLKRPPSVGATRLRPTPTPPRADPADVRRISRGFLHMRSPLSA